MGTTKVLLIESARNNGRTFSTSLQRKYDVEIAHSGKQGLAVALDTSPHVIILDADSLRTPGDRICQRLRDQLGALPIIHIKSEGDERGQSVADVVLTLPFTIRKLSNRIGQFATGPEEGKVRETGPFNLNLETQTLTTPWNEKKLTPKLMALMRLFLQHPEQTLERREIMQHVWETDYVEDTRTLDVHIRWLRQAVEPNPRKPKFLVTVRGVGYRFSIPDEGEISATADKPASGSKSTKQAPKKKASSAKKDNAAKKTDPPPHKKHKTAADKEDSPTREPSTPAQESPVPPTESI